MKNLKYFISLFVSLSILISCNEDDSFDYLDNVAAPSNISALVSITQDNTGLVTIIPNGIGAVSFDIDFGDGTEEQTGVNPGEEVQHTYTEGNYELKIAGSSVNGKTTIATQPLVVSFNPPQNLEVIIENDAAVSKQVNVTATADYAVSFDVYFGEDTNATPVSGNIGETVSYIYQNAGTYTIRVVAKGGAIETTEYTEEFTVTEILAPLTSAPTPPARASQDVISMFSDAYTDVTVDTWRTPWSDASFEDVTIDGNPTKRYSALNFVGIETTSTNIDVTAMTTMHMDIWSPNLTEFKIKLVDFGADGTFNGGDDSEHEITIANPNNGEWISLDIPLSDFTGLNSRANIAQLIYVGAPTGSSIVFIDNIYFYRGSPIFDDGLLTNGDFENGSTSWIVGVDDNVPAPVVTNSGNTYYSVNVTSAGNPFDVNLSQKVEIIQGKTYTLTFDAWSDTNRSILAGIGLSADPWTNNSQSVNITSTRNTYTLTLAASSFGASNARVLFDLGAETGVVNIDNVSLLFDDGLLTNGDFENGSNFWIIGVDDNTPAPVVTNLGNTYYSVNVVTAGNTFDVNLSQKVEIIQGNTYTLTFDAWSDTNRSIIAGIGLSADPWTNNSQSVDLTSTRTTYTLTLAASDFGASNARVLFDSGAETGVVNIDNVSLLIN